MSTPRPAKSDSSSAPRPVYCWTFPGAPIRVNVPLDLISRLRADLSQDENPDAGMPRVEAGGILLGHRVTPRTLEVDDYLWVSSPERPGSRYSFDISVLKRLREKYAGIDQGADPSRIVGYFRTQSEENLCLRDEEISLVSEHFRGPTDVVLLIRSSDKQYSSGFLFWMKDGDFAPFSFMDFPLDAALLQAPAGEQETAGSSPAAIDAAATDPTATGPTAIQPAAINNKDTPPLVDYASTPGTTPASAPAKPKSVDWGPKPGPTVRQWKSKPNGRTTQVEPAHTATSPARAASKREPAHISPRMAVTVAAMLASLALGALSAFLLRDRLSAEPKQKAPETAAAFPLQLEVEAQGEGLSVHWNPQSASVTHARAGRLAILESDQQPPRIIPLDLQQLRSGHIYYRSSAERVQFQLEIVDNSGGVSRESVLALSSKPVATATSAPPRAADGQIPARKVESIPLPSANTIALPAADAPVTPVNPHPAPRAFTAPPSARDFPEPVPAITLDRPPAISTNATPPTVALPGTLSNLPANRPPSPYTGSWSFVPDVSRYHGLAPVMFNVFVLEERGRLFGTVNARFAVSGNADPGVRFDFSGPLQAARYQAFTLQTTEGAKGKLELIPGNAPNLLEVNYVLDGAPGKVAESDVILVKR